METTRRNFIRTTSALLAGSVITPSLLHAEYNTLIQADVNSYLNHFEVTTNMLQKVIEAAMSKGGDYADLFFEDKKSNSLGLEDGKVNRSYSNVSFGVGIRVLKGDQTGFGYSETVHPDAMMEAAHMAANIANSKNEYMEFMSIISVTDK